MKEPFADCRPLVRFSRIIGMVGEQQLLDQGGQQAADTGLISLRLRLATAEARRHLRRPSSSVLNPKGFRSSRQAIVGKN